MSIRFKDLVLARCCYVIVAILQGGRAVHVDLLFLERYQRLLLLTEATTEINLLDLAATMRQLLVDKHSLVDAVNVNRLKLRFKTGVFKSISDAIPDMKISFESLEDSIDPETIGATCASVELSKDDFISHRVAIWEGKPITIKDMIKYASNAAGGVHHDPSPKPEYSVVHTASGQIEVGGLPFGIRALRAIGRVIVRALEPLAREVRERHGFQGA